MALCVLLSLPKPLPPQGPPTKPPGISQLGAGNPLGVRPFPLGELRLLAQLKDVLALEGETKDGAGAELPTEVWAEHAVYTRKTHKLHFMQLQVMKFLLDFLDSGPSIQDASFSGVRNEMTEAKQQWKTLKAEYQEKIEAVKQAVPQTLAKLEEARHRVELLEDALQRYQAKKREMEEKVRSAQDRHHKEQDRLCKLQDQMERQVAEVRGRLQTHREELQCLQRVLEEQERQACDWRQKVQTQSDFRCLLETLRSVKLQDASETELELELTFSQPLAIKPHRLKLSLRWGDDGSITLQSDCPFFLLSAALPIGSWGTIKNVFLELQQSYLQQAQLLAEIEWLQGCFAIDWQPEKRLLHYLKPSSTCTLYLEPGYPTSGGISLLSIKSQYGAVDVSVYRPSQEMPSLQNWLVYLSAMDFNAPFLARAAVTAHV